MITDLTPIQSYLYQQYAYDDTTQYIQPFFTAYNTQSQTNLDTINNLNLPIYWGLSGGLLDWVALSLYGFERPVLPQGSTRILGLYNTNELNKFAYNEEYVEAPQTFYTTTDDIFKRCITWNFYKGDGEQFDIQWLKRRIVRFLVGGANPDIQEHWQVSVRFPLPGEVLITINSSFGFEEQNGLYDNFNYDKVPLNQTAKIIEVMPTELAPILASAIHSGVLQLPVGFTYTVVY